MKDCEWSSGDLCKNVIQPCEFKKCAIFPLAHASETKRGEISNWLVSESGSRTLLLPPLALSGPDASPRGTVV